MQKYILLALLFTLVSGTLSAQEITGKWYGLLDVGIKLRVVLNITKSADGYSATMDSPDQGAKNIPVTTITFNNPDLTFAVPAGMFDYAGTLHNQKITGTFKQRGAAFPLELTREEITVKRPQEPKAPFPYSTEEVTFTNATDNVTLAGTLTIPPHKSKFPTVILISGSGPQNRDEELFGHKPFLLLADYLTRNGIAVLRFDDRGVAKSTGNFEKATSADFAKDVQAAVDFLKTRNDIDKKKIGLLGHSEGGMIAPMVAATRSDIAFIVLMAGPGVSGDALLLLQQEKIARASGVPEIAIGQTRLINTKLFNIVKTTTDAATLESKLRTELTNAQTAPATLDLTMSQLTQPWYQYFIRYDPAPALKKVKCPVLALNGDKDLQVPAKEDLSAIAAALKAGGNSKVTLKEYPELNHLFQQCTTGLISEYGKIEQTMSPEVLSDITTWISGQIK